MIYAGLDVGTTNCKIAKASKKYLIEGIGITSFGETCVFLDEFDQVILPSLLYTDTRGEKEAKEIEDLIGKEKLGQITGQIGRGMFSLSKIIALRNEYKEEFKNKEFTSVFLGGGTPSILTPERILLFIL